MKDTMYCPHIKSCEVEVTAREYERSCMAVPLYFGEKEPHCPYKQHPKKQTPPEWAKEVPMRETPFFRV